MNYQDQLTYSPVLCIQCATLNDRIVDEEQECVECGAIIDVDLHDDLFRYAFYAARYGHQYRSYYEDLEEDESRGKPMLEPLDPIFTFIGIAALSGILGGAAYDLAKMAIRKILSQQSNRKISSRSIELTDADIDRYVDNILSYHEDFKGIRERIRDELIEEMLGDAAAENPKISKHLVKLLTKEEITKKDKKKARKLYRKLADELAAKNKRPPSVPEDFSTWEKLKK